MNIRLDSLESKDYIKNMQITTRTSTTGSRALVNGKLLTVRQTEKFNYFMETSESFRKRFTQLMMEENK